MTKSWASECQGKSEPRTFRAILSFRDTDSPSHRARHRIPSEQALPQPPDLLSGLQLEVHRFDIEAHVDGCPESLIPCMAGLYGCDVVVKRKELAAHASLCALAKLAPFLKAQSERLRMSFGALSVPFRVFISLVIAAPEYLLKSFLPKSGYADSNSGYRVP